ncbi:interleukin-34 [Myotis lucifugus]|uniref:interleukin-34 n=1 Tax=Myotis lucifugus TaxID=59463 RepID=UPI000CCC1C77|nr:interleukin-34 [Myotis lucifugus]XP_023611833.1 interleukin-34 [Myotis lucifugus]XP_023611834.1 interleukin-34 [Myotis lucifugus]
MPCRPPRASGDRHTTGDAASAAWGTLRTTMPRGFAWLHYLGILLGMALGNQDLEVWPLTQSKECALTGILRDRLQYGNRLQYMVTRWPPPWPPTQAPWLMGRRGLDLQGPSLDLCQP